MAIITISRGTMSCGRRVAEKLCEKMGYTCVSREIIIQASDRYGIPEGRLFDAIQKSPTFFQKLSFERERYLACIQAILCEYAIKDNMIYHGHAGHFLLQGISHVLKIRIVADMPLRIKAVVDDMKITEKDAQKYIEKVDNERVKWTKFLYGADWRSPHLYDIVFNLSSADPEFVCEMVQHAVRQPQLQTTPESQRAMKNLLLASRVRAALAGIPNIRLEFIDVQADDGSILIRGRTKQQNISSAIFDVASRVPGVEKVDEQVEIDYRSHEID